MQMETKDLILRKAKFEDWEAMYENVWSHPETAKYMFWQVTTSREEAQERMKRTIEYQAKTDAYLICEKSTDTPIGFTGLEEIEPHVYRETSIALGPKYVSKGYGKQVIQLLMDYCKNVLGGEEFYYTARAENEASKALARSCGFVYRRSEEQTDWRNGEPFEMQIFSRKI